MTTEQCEDHLDKMNLCGMIGNGSKRMLGQKDSVQASIFFFKIHLSFNFFFKKIGIQREG